MGKKWQTRQKQFILFCVYFSLAQTKREHRPWYKIHSPKHINTFYYIETVWQTNKNEKKKFKIEKKKSSSFSFFPFSLVVASSSSTSPSANFYHILNKWFKISSHNKMSATLRWSDWRDGSDWKRSNQTTTFPFVSFSDERKLYSYF